MDLPEKDISPASSFYPEMSYTFEQYLALEEGSEYKNEFEKGRIIQMSGGTFRHSRLAANFSYAAQNVLRTKNSSCQVTDSNLKVYIEALDSSVYPDIMVICGEPLFWNERADVITNPLVVVEILSRYTENYDRGRKFRKYRALPSFREYILVSQQEIEVEVWSLRNDGAWSIQTASDLNDHLYIPALDVHLSLEDLYYQIDFSAAY